MFVPVLLLTGAAQYLFTPLAMAVVFAMMASYLLSRTLIPTMVHYMLRPGSEALCARASTANRRAARASSGACTIAFNRRFERMRASYTALLHWCLDHRALVLAGSRSSSVGSLGLIALHRPRFLPHVDSGQMRLHARAARGHAHREDRADLRRRSRTRSASVIPPREIDTIIDNIGIPNGGFNLAFGDSPTIGVE